MWRFRGDDVGAARERVEAALDARITLFDTADIYGPDNGEPFGAAEALLGRVFAEAPDLRDRMVLASKGGIVIGTPYDSGRAYLERAIDASLARLGVDHIALWQVHRPDILTHPEELARTLEEAVRAGKIGAVGVSNFTGAQIESLAHFLTIPLATTQPEFSPLALASAEDGQFDQAMRLGLSVLAWSPLGGGRIAQPETGRERAVATALDAVAEAQGVSRAAATYSWIMAHPARPIPIVGSQTPARIAEAADALKVRWTRSDWYAVFEAARGEPLP
ncbi:aldo/keto reductase [Parasphingopyxis algicola]|nr:aldo/keto reductase [Parasphingopyxis algicola]